MFAIDSRLGTDIIPLFGESGRTVQSNIQKRDREIVAMNLQNFRFLIWDWAIGKVQEDREFCSTGPFWNYYHLSDTADIEVLISSMQKCNQTLNLKFWKLRFPMNLQPFDQIRNYNNVFIQQLRFLKQIKNFIRRK